jgi:4a-hydroxytetrahydrobiopterin dehydratase
MAWEDDGGGLVQVRQMADFVEALAYVNRVGEVAESRGHHPDIDIRWNTVTLRLTTHSAGHTITDKDRALAAAIDALDDTPPET